MTVDISKAAVEIVLTGLRTREWPEGFAPPSREYWADMLSALSARVEDLERALEGIDVIASRHEKGAAGLMQKVARAALNPKEYEQTKAARHPDQDGEAAA